ncbi:MAG: dTMP kinase [Chitinivibrionales bacterium]|nr:dTMP kinase [Chitinivibrionales bacterium]
MRKGLFITFEGIDGCGKSTQVGEAAKRLEKDSIPCLVTREPGGTPIGEKIREIILSNDNVEMGAECELLLYLASRAQHVFEKILPAVESGKIVLCDRFQDATFAYQGYGRGLSISQLQQLNEFSTRNRAPDLTFIFDCTVDEAAERLKKSNKAPDRLEGNSRDFHERIRNGYLALAEQNPKRCIIFSGDESVETLSWKVYERIQQLINEINS